jgi:uridine phosphorylase
MEASTLFVVGAALGVRCGAVFHVVWNQERAALGLDTDAEEDHNTDKAIRTAIRAVQNLIEQQ